MKVDKPETVLQLCYKIIISFNLFVSGCIAIRIIHKRNEINNKEYMIKLICLIGVYTFNCTIIYTKQLIFFANKLFIIYNNQQDSSLLFNFYK